MTQKNTEKQIRLITSTKEFESLHNQWNSLLDQNHIKSAILTWEWLFAWWTVFGEKKQLWIVTVWENENLVGIAPLMLEKRKKNGLPLKTLCSLGAPTNDIGGYLVRKQDNDVLTAINDYILHQKLEWDLFELNEFKHDSFEIAPTRKIFQTSNLLLIDETNEHYHVSVEGNWDEYYESLSKKFRKNLRRAQRNSQKLGDVEIRHYKGNEIRWEIFEDMIEVNCHANFPRVCDSKKEQAFLEKLHKTASQWLTVYLLYADGKPIAYEYGFLYNNRLEDWRAGFDTRIDPSISIGKFMALNILQDAFDNSLSEVDFMRGSHDYKREWNPSSRTFVQLRFFRFQSIKALLAYIGLKKIKPFLKNRARK